MSFKEHLSCLYKEKKWEEGFVFVRNNVNHQNEYNYILSIYFLHEVLVEGHLKENKEAEAEAEKILRDLFNSYRLHYSDNDVFTFFLSNILPVSEWYFGLNEDSKPIEDRLHRVMQKRIVQRNKSNLLFQWLNFFSEFDTWEKAKGLANKILTDEDQSYVDFLHQMSFAGENVMEKLHYSCESDE